MTSKDKRQIRKNMAAILNDLIDGYDLEYNELEPKNLAEMARVEWLEGAVHACTHLLTRLNDMFEEKK